MPNIKREPAEITREDTGNSVQETNENNQRMPQPSMPGNVQHSPAPGPPSFELDFSHGFHFASPAVMAAMNQQIALMNQALPPFLQHGGMYTGGPGLMFAPGLPPTNFLPPTRDENPLASLAANLNLNKRSLSPPDSNSPEAKKQRLHHSMRMLKDEPVPEGYVRFVLVIISSCSKTLHFQTFSIYFLQVQIQRRLPVPSLRLQGTSNSFSLHAPRLWLLVLRQDAFRSAYGKA